jgi:hypothetical protein
MIFSEIKGKEDRIKFYPTQQHTFMLDLTVAASNSNHPGLQ